MREARVQGIMGSVSSLISGGRGCRASSRKVKKGFPGKRGLNNQQPAGDGNAKLNQRAGNSEDFFYIKVSHKARTSTEEPGDEAAPGRERMKSARLEQTTEKTFMSGFPRTSSSLVETHHSLNTILGTKLGSKRATPEPKREASRGSPSDSGISGSSWTSEGANKWTNGASGEGGASTSRSASALSDCIQADVGNELRESRSPFSERSSVSADEPVVDRKLQSGGSELQLSSLEVKVSQHALRAQQLLQLQVTQLQEDKQRLQEEVDQLVRDRDSAERSFTNQNPLTPALEETQWEVCQKAGEISLLKQQLKDSQADVVNKLNEIISLKSTLRETRSKLEELEEKNQKCEETLHLRNTEIQVCENELQRKKNEADLLREKVGKLESDLQEMKHNLTLAKEEHQELLSVKTKLQEHQRQLQVCRDELAEREASEDLGVLQKEVERLSVELEEEKQQKEKILSSFRNEKQTWNKEKEKVIRYQKQLQYNYIQTQRRNQDLETTLREQTVKKDASKTEHGPDVQEAELPFDDDMVATII